RLCDNGPSHHPHFQMVNTPHLTFGVAVAEEATTMEEELKRWALHDCSAFRDTLVPDEMKRLFERFRATRGKHVMLDKSAACRGSKVAGAAQRILKMGGCAVASLVSRDRTVESGGASWRRYPAWGPTSAPSSAAVRESYWCGVERRDPWVERGDLRAPEYGRQYGEHAPPYQQVAPDRHVRTEDQRGWEDAPEMRRLHQRLEILERENQTCVIGCSGSATSGEIAGMRARRVHRVARDDRR
ncbi:hypothetical protein L914_19361, partial [Phytophthora nicotianae]